MNGKAFDQHQADEGFAQTDTVAEKCAAIFVGPLEQATIAILLIPRENGENAGPILFPLAGGLFVTKEILLKRACINLKRKILPNMPFKGLENFRRNVLCLLPVLVVPFLQDSDRRAGDLNVKFNILR